MISGFRIGKTGMAGRLGIRPDLVTFGKVIGGGFPVGAYAGRKALMERVAPAGSVYQAGTLSANPIGMRAGLASLAKVDAADGWDDLDARDAAFCAQLADGFAALAQPLDVVRDGSIFWIRRAHRRRRFGVPIGFPPGNARVVRALLPCGRSRAASTCRRRPYEVGFVSLAHDADTLDTAAWALVAAAREADTRVKHEPHHVAVRRRHRVDGVHRGAGVVVADLRLEPGAPPRRARRTRRARKSAASRGCSCSKASMLVGMLVAGGVALLGRDSPRAAPPPRPARVLHGVHARPEDLADVAAAAGRGACAKICREAAGNPNLQRMLKDSVRLQLQLENALCADHHRRRGASSRRSTSRALVDYLRDDFPELQIDVTGDARVRADRRALESVLRNLLQNAVVHGRATRVVARAATLDRPARSRSSSPTTAAAPSVGSRRPRSIGRSCGRPRPADRASGLYVCGRLLHQMHGHIRVHRRHAAGLQRVSIELPEAV